MATATLLTQGAQGWEAAATDGFTSASISPGANCALVLLIGCVADDNGAARDLLTGSSVTSSGSGPTWTERATGGQPAASFEANGGVYTAVIGGTDPGSFTVSWAANFTTQVGARAYAIYKITGHDTGTTFGGKIATAPETGNGAESATLDAAPASADITLALGYADEDDTGGGFGAAFDTGWTEDYDGSSVSGFKGAFNVGQRTSSTSTTVSWTDINTGSHTYSSALVAIVVKAAAGDTNASAGHSSATGAANAPTASIKPSAGHSSATGAANAPTASVKPSAGNAAATGAANAPTTKVDVSAGHASATGAAYDATASIKPSAGNAAATGAANDPTTKIDVSAGHASATGAAYNPSVSTGGDTNVNAGHASATGAAYDATVSIKPSAEHSSATGAANAATTSIQPSAGNAAGTGAANDPTTSVKPSAGHASATGSAFDASVWVSVSAAVAAATGQAQAPTAAVYATAGHASATAAAYDATGPSAVDSTPLTLTVRDSGHTATVTDEGHTLTVRGSGHTSTAKASPRHHSTTVRARGHTSTARENR